MRIELKHRILGMVIGILLTFITLNEMSKYSIDVLLLAISIGALIAYIVASTLGILIVLAIIISAIQSLKKRLK